VRFNERLLVALVEETHVGAGVKKAREPSCTRSHHAAALRPSCLAQLAARGCPQKHDGSSERSDFEAQDRLLDVSSDKRISDLTSERGYVLRRTAEQQTVQSRPAQRLLECV
jgi:hypothetical protein